MPVQVIPERIHPEMPVMHPIDVYHGHHHKYKHLPEQIRPHILPIGQELQDPLHSIRRRRLRWMHPGRNQHNRLPKHDGPIILRKQLGIENNLLFGFLLVMGAYRQQMDRPVFGTEGQNLLVVVELVDVEVITELLQHFHVVAVGKGVAEGEIHDVRLLFEQVLEADLDDVVLAYE
jgi:hypothetical protein